MHRRLRKDVLHVLAIVRHCTDSEGEITFQFIVQQRFDAQTVWLLSLLLFSSTKET
jgi:hypothetical protein